MSSCPANGPRRSARVAHFCARQCWRGIILTILFAALLITAARLLLPQLDAYRSDVEAAVSRAMGQPVTVAEFELGWHRLGPRLLMKNVQVWDAAGEQPLLGFRAAEVEINVWSSLRSRALDMGALTLIGVDLALRLEDDGALRVEGLQLPASNGGGGGDQALQWLWRQGRIAVEESTLRWRDPRTPEGGWLFEDVNLHLRNQGRRHVLVGEARLPEALGQRVTLKLDLFGNGTTVMADWEMRGYLDLVGIHLANPGLARLETWGVTSRGHGDARVWVHRQGGRWRSFQGSVALRDIHWRAARRDVELEYDGLSGVLSWHGSVGQWRLDVADLRLERNGESWPVPVRARVNYQRGDDGSVVEAGINFARLQDVTDVTLLAGANEPQSWARTLEALAPGGDVRDFFLRIDLPEAGEPDYFARGEIHSGRLSAWRQLPAVQGLDVKFNLDQDSGVAVINADALVVDADLFRQPLPPTALRGQVAWQRDAGAWLVEARHLKLSNRDISGDIDGQFVLPHGASPVVRLRAEVRDGDGSQTRRYLPVKRMAPSAVKWLDQAIVSGNLTSGLVELEGPLSGFPYDDGSGRFNVVLNVRDAIIDYSAGWPRVEQAEAEVKFSGRSLAVNGYSGKMLGSDLSKVKVAIPDLGAHPVVVNIDGLAGGPLQDAVRFLTEAPELKAQFGDYLVNTETHGDSRLALNIHLPLGRGHKLAVSGSVDFDRNDITFHNYDVDLAAVRGRMFFTDQGLTAEALKAVVLGQPASVDVRTEHAGASPVMVFEAHGETRYEELEQRLPYIPVFEYLDGVSIWTARLRIPQDTAAGPVTLTADSAMAGTTVKLPHPLGKAAELERPMRLEGVLGDASSEWRFDYDQASLTGVFELLGRDGESVLQRGALQFAGRADLPPEWGIRVAGPLEVFNDQEWDPILFPEEPAVADSEGAVVNVLDITAKHGVMFEYEMNNIQLTGKLRDGIWHARLDSDEMSGDLQVPEDFTQPLVMALDFVHIPAFEEPAEVVVDEAIDPSDPAEFPPLRVEADRLFYGGQELGQLLLLTRPVPGGLSLERLAVDGKTGVLEATGQWLRVGDAHSSSLQGDLTVRDLGKLLKRLGYTQPLENGRGRVKLDLRWPRPLSDPTVASLNGDLSFELTDGSLLEVEPGAGRLFGLLSVQALPRRLRLDFRDFFGRGFGFDLMRGRFNIQSANAYTNDFIMKGPAADIAIEGRIGMIAQDYDQELSITPHVTSGLPLVGALTGGLGVGAAVLLAERILKPSIDEATQVRYTVTGSWDDPVFTRRDVPRTSGLEDQ